MKMKQYPSPAQADAMLFGVLATTLECAEDGRSIDETFAMRAAFSRRVAETPRKRGEIQRKTGGRWQARS